MHVYTNLPQVFQRLLKGYTKKPCQGTQLELNSCAFVATDRHEWTHSSRLLMLPISQSLSMSLNKGTWSCCCHSIVPLCQTVLSWLLSDPRTIQQGNMELQWWEYSLQKLLSWSKQLCNSSHMQYPSSSSQRI